MGRRRSKPIQTKHLPIPKMQAIPEEDAKPKYFPVFTFTLSIIQVVLYLLISGDVISPEPLVFKHAERYQLWRYITVALAPTGIINLGSNLVAQVVYGRSLEISHGWGRTALIYFSGTFLAELSLPVFVGPNVEGEGSFAGALALISAYFASTILDRQVMARSKLLGIGSYLLCIIEPFSFIVCMSIIIPYCNSSRSDSRDTFKSRFCERLPQGYLQSGGVGFLVESELTNVAGEVAGILVGLSVLKLEGSSKPWKIVLQQVCSVIVVVMFSSLIAINIIRWDY